MEELRECPFCGGKARQSYVGAKHIIICPNCVKLPADGGYIDSKDAITAWNARLGNWISVEEMLPRTQVMVLTCTEFGEISMEYYRKAFRGFTDKSFPTKDDISGGVTHWMPLPEPPKGDKN